MSKKRRKYGKKWEAAAEAVIEKYGAMGFRHDAARAQGARDVLKAMGVVPVAVPHEIIHVTGVVPVMETY